MSLFVLSSRDGWVNIMYTGLDAVGVDQQVSTCLTTPTFKVMSLPHHHYQVLLLLVEHRASMKSFQALQSPAIPLTSFHAFPVPLISSSIVLHHVLLSLPLLLYP